MVDVSIMLGDKALCSRCYCPCTFCLLIRENIPKINKSFKGVNREVEIYIPFYIQSRRVSCPYLRHFTLELCESLEIDTNSVTTQRGDLFPVRQRKENTKNCIK